MTKRKELTARQQIQREIKLFNLYVVTSLVLTFLSIVMYLVASFLKETEDANRFIFMGVALFLMALGSYAVKLTLDNSLEIYDLKHPDENHLQSDVNSNIIK